MNHKVNDVGLLYEDAKELFGKVVKEQADNIINDLNGAITILKDSWKGADAGVQINNVVGVYNGMVNVRNALAHLAVDASLVAVNYRDIQRLNSANLDPYQPLEMDSEKPSMEEYSDTKNTIDINTNAANGRSKLDACNDTYDDFRTAVDRYYNAIMDNWQEGPGRNNADAAFAEFMNNATKYKEILEDVSRSITTALANYQF